MKLSYYCNKVIEFSFYSLFFFVPILLSQHTSELFELNKMWFTWGATVIIASAWATKMLVEKKFIFQRTFFDIPILLFLASQIISTIFSLDQRVSFFGYYSRFNGGLLSMLTYVLLYYAFVSNLSLTHVKKVISLSLFTGLFVSLWGFPSHFGKDPNCLLFRGTLDVSCWTEAFHPTVRIFSTLGQPAWLAAYLALLLPIATAITIVFFKKVPDFTNNDSKYFKSFRVTFFQLSLAFSLVLYLAMLFRLDSAGSIFFLAIVILSIYYFLSLKFFKQFFYVSLINLPILFYVCQLFANTRAGFLGFWIAYIIFWTVIWIMHCAKSKTYPILILFGANMLLIAYTILKSSYPLFWFVGVIGYLLLLLIFYRKALLTKIFLTLNIALVALTFFFSSPFPEINSVFSYSGLQAKLTPAETSTPAPMDAESQPAAPAGPALEVGGTNSATIRRIVWKGAIDAWLANPIFGTGVETFAFAYYKHRPAEHNLTSEWDYLYNKAHNEYLNYLTTTGIFGLGSYLLFIGFVLYYITRYFWKRLDTENTEEGHYVVPALAAGFISILITNFFGFSVVIMNLYLFLIPAFILMYTGYFKNKENTDENQQATSAQWLGIMVIGIIAGYLLITLLRFWYADRAYALGFNLHRVGDYQNAYMKLNEAITLRSTEPIFRDEFALSNATIATALYLQQASASAEAMQQANQFAQQAILLTNDVTKNYPNNIVFWKNRVKIFYLLSSAATPDKKALLEQAIFALEKVHQLAPTDVKVMYNLGTMYRENGQPDMAVPILEKAVLMRPTYKEAYYELGLAYYENGDREKAVTTMNTLLEKIDPEDGETRNRLREWDAASASEAADTR